MLDTAYRPVYGFLLSLLTAFLWGVLPVALTLCLTVMDSPTITFFRFITAGVVVLALLQLNNNIPTLNMLSKKAWWLAIGATIMLVTNYVTNVMGLRFLSASSAQVLMQIAPFVLMLGGILIYKESFTKVQFCGAMLLVCGLGLFFNQRLPQIFASETESVWGIVIIAGSAIAWACYALAQKPLLKSLSARQLTLIMYLLGSLLLLPVSTPGEIMAMDTIQFAALVFCCLNTLVAYGAFTEAMRVWYASKVSAVLAVQPLFTFISMTVAENIAPEVFHQPDLDSIAYTGGFLVVCGSMLAALGRKKQKTVLSSRLTGKAG